MQTSLAMYWLVKRRFVLELTKTCFLFMSQIYLQSLNSFLYFYHMRLAFSLLALFSIVFQCAWTQDSITDPLQKYRRIHELGITLLATQVISESNLDESAAIYKFDRRIYYVPDLDANFSTGWIKSSGNAAIIEKIGIWLSSRTVNLPSPVGGDIQYNVGFLSIPVQIGFRLPLNHSNYKNGMYRAIEMVAGVQLSTPLVETLYGYQEFNPVSYGIFGKYIKFGINAEIIFTSLNEFGHGHRYGLRLSTDAKSFFKTGDTHYEIYPVFSSVGLFYNLQNVYR